MVQKLCKKNGIVLHIYNKKGPVEPEKAALEPQEVPVEPRAALVEHVAAPVDPVVAPADKGSRGLVFSPNGTTTVSHINDAWFNSALGCLFPPLVTQTPNLKMRFHHSDSQHSLPMEQTCFPSQRLSLTLETGWWARQWADPLSSLFLGRLSPFSNLACFEGIHLSQIF